MALNVPSLPALIFGLLFSSKGISNLLPSGDKGAHHIATNSIAMLASFPVRALVPGSELAASEDLVGRSLRREREHLVHFAGVDQNRRLGELCVFLSGAVARSAMERARVVPTVPNVPEGRHPV